MWVIFRHFKSNSSSDSNSSLSIHRQPGQNTQDEVKKKNYKRELEEKERIAYEERSEKSRSHRHGSLSNLAITSGESERLALPSTKKTKTDHISLDIDADDPVYLSDDDEQEKDSRPNSDSENDEGSEDETADLLAELNKLKKERAIEDAKREAEQKAREEKIRIENILHGNPLNNKSEFKVKRRWNDDVVFKNCSRGEDDKEKSSFINDTLRSDFHRKFMDRYIK